MFNDDKMKGIYQILNDNSRCSSSLYKQSSNNRAGIEDFFIPLTKEKKSNAPKAKECSKLNSSK
ncbi:MAG: hypothetical protein LCH30_11405 [Proteobacteria bacterium]|nr:hypothetical protein [Pseudomonadota bacterium]